MIGAATSALGFHWLGLFGLLRRCEDLGFDQQRDFDSGGDAPAFLGGKAESFEGVGQGLAQAQTVEEIEGGALRVLRR